LIHFSGGGDGVFCPGEFGEAFFFDWFVCFYAQAKGSIGDAGEGVVDFVDQLAVCCGQVEVEPLFKAFGAELCGVAGGLGFTCV